jgi:hypothetical protein
MNPEFPRAAMSGRRTESSDRPGDVPPGVAWIPPDAPRRREAEAFIAAVFADSHGARIESFMPNLVLLERASGPLAALGWRGAGTHRLFLEAYLDGPVERHISHVAGTPVARERVAEVGHLASNGQAGGARLILAMAPALERMGFEWVVFTATAELLGIFQKLGLMPMALATADPARLGEQAQAWGSYYRHRPIVVAGRIRQALREDARA